MNNYEKPPPYSPHESHKEAHPDAVNSFPKPPPYSPPAFPSGYQAPPLNPYQNPHQPIIYTTPPQYGSVPVFANNVGCCPACRVGYLVDDYPCMAICLALFCFPCGICCCLGMKRRRCPYCGASFT